MFTLKNSHQRSNFIALIVLSLVFFLFITIGFHYHLSHQLHFHPSSSLMQKISQFSSTNPHTSVLASSPAYDCSNGILALTYASHLGSDDRFCRSLVSAARHKVDLRILGWQVPWKGLTQKLTSSLSFLRAIPSQQKCAVMFNDAFDVIYSSSLPEVRKSFNDLNKEVVFSAECGCWPQILRGHAACFDNYPRSPTELRYLNSGQWIASKEGASKILTWLTERHDGPGKMEHMNDQEILNDLFALQANTTVDTVPPISLDYHASIFLALHSTDPPDLASCHPAQHTESRDGYWYYQGRQKPAVLHFNGGGKAHHLPFESKMWYRKLPVEPALRDFKFWAGAPESMQQITLGEICSKYDLSFP